MKESLGEITLQVYEDQKVVSIAQRAVIKDSVGRCHHYHPRVEIPYLKYFLNDGDDDEMQGFSGAGAALYSGEAQIPRFYGGSDPP